MIGVRSACEHFDEHADALALGQVDEPLRSQLLAHSADCPRCHSLLDGLATVIDRLLLVAPHVEPPAGFEGRALGRIGVAATARRRTRRSRWLLAPAVAVAVAVALVAGVMRLADDERGARETPIVAATGAVVGSVRLVAEPEPHVLVTVDSPRPDPGVRHCELRRPGGTWAEVGTWEVADLAAGVWAVGIPPELLTATAMRVTLDDGTVVATAAFSR